MNVAIISLGCSKNLVNSEQMMWLIEREGHTLCAHTDMADAVIVNTCGFLESACSEAVETIIELGLKKNTGRPGLILAAGCMVERHKHDVLADLPELDGVIGCGGFDDVIAALDGAAAGKRPEIFGDINAPVSETGRILGTPGYYAYLKIAEGCDNRCAFCVIPSLRGGFRSRPREAVIGEARELVKNGARELILVAQDTTRYGLDLYGRRALPPLIDELCGIEGLHWLRLHYLYPDDVSDELLDVMAAQPKCVKYFDIPIQHCNDGILRAMGRRGGKAALERLVARIRDKLPGAVLRTSVIAGLPGETPQAFEELCDFLRQTKWERAGVFEYSAEDGSAAAEMDGQVEAGVKSRRREIIEDIRREIADDFNARHVGQALEVLCEGYDRVADCYYGRSQYDAPEVDGKVFFMSDEKIEPGRFVSVVIDGAVDGDMTGEVLQN